MEDRFRCRVWTHNKMYYLGDGGPMILIDKNTWYLHEGGIESWHSETSEKQGGVLMQCTGLKDKNDKLIYEGDIVKFRSVEGDEYVEKLIFCNHPNYAEHGGGNLMWVNVCNEGNRYCFNEYDTSGYVCKWNSLCIIGNIHENPELLTQETTPNKVRRYGEVACG